MQGTLDCGHICHCWLAACPGDLIDRIGDVLLGNLCQVLQEPRGCLVQLQIGYVDKLVTLLVVGQL